ncbi:unnamed protein product [Adineta ricciae]|uniref:Uncharacterized protein n=1 Tax=Adineta ricciae TaxID=249248 RepID=A0A814RZY6_ADIRI|nr:unnamed protein product [Adineta ricciae]
MTCQHPRCSLPIHSICSNHCFWSLCSHHLDEHRTILINEFEQIVQDLIKPTNVLSKSVEQTKENMTKDQQLEFDLLERSHQNQIQKFDQRLIAISRLQIQHNQMCEHLVKIKNNETSLTQDDFQKVDKLIQEINQHKTLPTDFDISRREKQVQSNDCPLKSLNVYGLHASHNVRLCTHQKRSRDLYNHFRYYHQLTKDYANILQNAVLDNLDPKKTVLFPADAVITDVHKKYPFSKRYLPVHLKTIHHLRAAQIQEVVKSTKFEN